MLGRDYPGLQQAAFQPPGVDDATVYGYVVNGVHYRSNCPTRYGPYPYCDVLDLPSYSLAKSLVGSITYQLIIARWPEFATIPVSELIPECKTPDKRWDDVFPIHLLDMTTGNYDSMIINVDDDSDVMQTFFLAESHGDKVRFSCQAWPRKSSPGTQWAYHTSDTYLLGVAMNSFLKQKLGTQADIYLDLLYPLVFKPLELSPTLQWTQRTYDKISQPFSGYGLIFHADDIARLAQALNSDQSTTQYLDSVNFEGSVLPANSPANTFYDANGLSYSRGFWGVDASRWMICKDITWIPFMSGYGGIVVAMFPDGSVYYYFTDSNQHGFRHAAVEANKAINYCKES
jgi:CubicO group peptidase (beta-lactamase class C family)